MNFNRAMSVFFTAGVVVLCVTAIVSAQQMEWLSSVRDIGSAAGLAYMAHITWSKAP